MGAKLLLCLLLGNGSRLITLALASEPSTEQNAKEGCPNCVCGGSGGVGSEGLRVVGGNYSQIGTYPWMAALFHRETFVCGGSLINDRYILTAAHCVARTNPRDLLVFLKRPNILHGNPEMLRRQIIAIKLNRYQGLRNNNDVALLSLQEPVQFGTDLMPICLPSGSDSYQGKEAMVIGWGVTANGTLSDVLQELMVPILSNQECKRSGYFRFQITSRMLCAGFLEGGKDSCQILLEYTFSRILEYSHRIRGECLANNWDCIKSYHAFLVGN
ncbi:trypsin II-P29-like isoform X2 [Wyeomyia smithii]|uniref:trypsin II-P29-like isoform X2 n=1 Tax=Wyeomyia smithii TaxID=174621 RepID=UPI0024681A1B|nr:trypsin II-P29-like isoform X2 [Wyeomyia smithii]